MPLVYQTAKERLRQEILIKSLPGTSMQIDDSQPAAGSAFARLPYVCQERRRTIFSRMQNYIPHSPCRRGIRLDQAVFFRRCLNLLYLIGTKNRNEWIFSPGNEYEYARATKLHQQDRQRSRKG